MFTLTAFDLLNQKTSQHTFDYVIVANGHFSTPNVPQFDGFENFPGRILHSHEFKDAREFAEQNVLLIGSGYSAEDIASQLWKFGAREVIISYRLDLCPQSVRINYDIGNLCTVWLALYLPYTVFSLIIHHGVKFFNPSLRVV